MWGRLAEKGDALSRRRAAEDYLAEYPNNGTRSRDAAAIVAAAEVER